MRKLRRTDYLDALRERDKDAADQLEKDVRELWNYDFDWAIAWYTKTVAAWDHLLALAKPVDDNPEAEADYNYLERTVDHAKAFLACNDRFFLLVYLIGREDLKHPWLYERAREVEAAPFGYIDLWARFHGKSSIITFGGIVQDVLCDPEITICIFSVTKDIAREFLAQIKNEFESNEDLKRIFCDVLFFNPRGKGTDGKRPAKWSLHRGITVKRLGRPKEATIEAHGLIDGQPTGRHFHRHYYDDIVTQDHLTEEQLKKATERFQMADNLGSRQGVEKSIAGTRYHFADAYGVALDRGSAKPRIYPATTDGTINGALVLLTPEHWTKIKRDQGLKIVSAQMLLNPLAGTEATFRPVYLRGYEVFPRIMNVYILVDPSKGTGKRSDRTAIPVIGIDPAGNKYLIDGYCHRMKLSERWEHVKALKAKWEGKTLTDGIQSVKVGWERYGKDVEIEVIEDMMQAENNTFEIKELNTPRQGSHSKPDRIERLEPDFRNGRFYLPGAVHHRDFGGKEGPFAGMCLWRVWTEEDDLNSKRMGEAPKHHVGQIIYREMKGYTKLQREYGPTRTVLPITRLDENKERYDLTRVFIEEFILQPFAPHDDLLDATSRIYDMDPLPPIQIDTKKTESIDVDDRGIDQSGVGQPSID